MGPIVEQSSTGDQRQYSLWVRGRALGSVPGTRGHPPPRYCRQPPENNDGVCAGPNGDARHKVERSCDDEHNSSQRNRGNDSWRTQSILVSVTGGPGSDPYCRPTGIGDYETRCDLDRRRSERPPARHGTNPGDQSQKCASQEVDDSDRCGPGVGAARDHADPDEDEPCAGTSDSDSRQSSGRHRDKAEVLELPDENTHRAATLQDETGVDSALVDDGDAA